MDKVIQLLLQELGNIFLNLLNVFEPKVGPYLLHQECGRVLRGVFALVHHVYMFGNLVQTVHHRTRAIRVQDQEFEGGNAIGGFLVKSSHHIIRFCAF